MTATSFQQKVFAVGVALTRAEDLHSSASRPAASVAQSASGGPLPAGDATMGVIRKKTAARGAEGGVKYVCDVCSADITSTVSDRDDLRVSRR